MIAALVLLTALAGAQTRVSWAQLQATAAGVTGARLGWLPGTWGSQVSRAQVAVPAVTVRLEAPRRIRVSGAVTCAVDVAPGPQLVMIGWSAGRLVAIASRWDGGRRIRTAEALSGDCGAVDDVALIQGLEYLAADSGAGLVGARVTFWPLIYGAVGGRLTAAGKRPGEVTGGER